MALSIMMKLLFCTTSMHRKTSTFLTIRTQSSFDLEDIDESESFAECRFRKQDIRILKEILQNPDTITCSQNVAGHAFRCF